MSSQVIDVIIKYKGLIADNSYRFAVNLNCNYEKYKE